jgi:hypothetical protein
VCKIQQFVINIEKLRENWIDIDWNIKGNSKDTHLHMLSMLSSLSMLSTFLMKATNFRFSYKFVLMHVLAYYGQLSYFSTPVFAMSFDWAHEIFVEILGFRQHTLLVEIKHYLKIHDFQSFEPFAAIFITFLHVSWKTPMR